MVLETLGLVVGLWAFNALALAVLPVSAAIRSLLDCGPTDRSLANYLLGTGALALTQFVVLLGVVLAVGGISTGESGPTAFLMLLAPVWGVAVLAAVLLGGVLPARGRWDPSDGGVDGRAVLALGTLWYVLATGLAMLVIGFVAFLFGYPG